MNQYHISPTIQTPAQDPHHQQQAMKNMKKSIKTKIIINPSLVSLPVYPAFYDG
jgi:hypothetical protein